VKEEACPILTMQRLTACERRHVCAETTGDLEAWSSGRAEWALGRRLALRGRLRGSLTCIST